MFFEGVGALWTPKLILGASGVNEIPLLLFDFHPEQKFPVNKSERTPLILMPGECQEPVPEFAGETM